MDTDAVLIQEVWAPGQIKQLLAGVYHVMISDTMDQGTGYRVAWRRDLPAPDTNGQVIYDKVD